MKKILFSISLLVFASGAFALGDKFRLGVAVAPGVSWLSAEGKDLNGGPAAFGLRYGIVFEYYFKDQNYAFVTGLHGGIEGGGLRDRDTFSVLASGSVLEKYSSQTVCIPLYLKLKTNTIGNSKFRAFGQFGIDPVLTVYSRATFDKKLNVPGYASPIEVTKENLLRGDNEAAKAIADFRYNYFDIRLGIMAGFEYEFNEKTSGVFSIGYHNGFLNMVRDNDPKGDPIFVRNFLFSFGVMF